MATSTAANTARGLLEVARTLQTHGGTVCSFLSKRLLFLTLCPLFACAIPNTPTYPSVVSDPNQAGSKFCSNLDASARDLANLQTTLAFGDGILAAAAIGAGTYLTATNTDAGGSVSARRWGIGLTLGSVPLAYLSSAHAGRAQAAAKLAEVANDGIREDEDRGAYEKCVTGKGAWASSKGDASKVVEAMNAETQKQREVEKAKASNNPGAVGIPQPAPPATNPPAL